MDKTKFKVIVEKDEDGYLTADVPSLQGCHTQARNMKELMQRLKEVISLCIETETPVKRDVFLKEIKIPTRQLKPLLS